MLHSTAADHWAVCASHRRITRTWAGHLRVIPKAWCASKALAAASLGRVAGTVPNVEPLGVFSGIRCRDVLDRRTRPPVVARFAPTHQNLEPAPESKICPANGSASWAQRGWRCAEASGVREVYSGPQRKVESSSNVRDPVLGAQPVINTVRPHVFSPAMNGGSILVVVTAFGIAIIGQLATSAWNSADVYTALGLWSHDDRRPRSG